MSTKHYKRAISIRKDKSFFLWGPRQCGKTQYLRHNYPSAQFIDLLKSEELLTYSQQPENLRKELLAEPQDLVVIDEIQKAPELLNEVHWLIENTETRFALSGSSARKLKRGAANLLGGRAIRYELFGLTSLELKDDFNLLRALNHGNLPAIYTDEQPADLLRSYVSDYLKEEILEEGLARSLPPFAEFLRAVAISDTEMVNYQNIASDCGVSKDTAKNYYSILVDTLLGRFLPAYTRREKRKVIRAPRFYFFDVGIVNHLAKRSLIEPGSELFGKAFENWVFHELSAYSHYSNRHLDYSYWRLASGAEVDFVVDDARSAIEVKGTDKVHNRHLKGLREFKKEHPEVESLYVVANVSKSRVEEDKITILSVEAFRKKLWAGELF